MLIKQHACFQAAASDWRLLAAEMPAVPLAGPLWWRCWLDDGLQAPDQPKRTLLTVHELDGRAGMLLALERRRVGPLTVLEPVGGDVSPARAMLVSPAFARSLDPAAARALIVDLAAAAGGADLIRLPDQTAMLGEIANPFLGESPGPADRAIEVAQLCQPWDRFDARHRGCKTRRKEQRRERQLAERGPLRFRVAATAAERKAFAHELLRQRTCTKGGSECLKPLGQIACSRVVERIAALDGADQGPQAWLTALECNGKLLSVMLGAVEGETYAGLHLSLAEGEACTHGPADLLITWTLRHAVESGLTTFRFPPLASARLDLWTDRWIELHRVGMPLTRVGQLAERVRHSSPQARRAFEIARLASAELTSAIAGNLANGRESTDEPRTLSSSP